ncbi:hypothetical protein GCM10023194_32180 [Planotetraspora phitsanulokensis]|uniref:Uncharacterized protein n=1 Tax=Planotetraspora phitsanulokensis TaxID=575192 RepID=A0A8J3XGK6_9ACTN|nr:hypothetical protein Pph01_06460 [Planotetraspora phitsanulokensis]
MRRLSKVFLVALIGFAVIVMVIFVRNVYAWESCGDDTGSAVADTEIYGAPSPAECSIVRNQPSGFTPPSQHGALWATGAHPPAAIMHRFVDQLSGLGFSTS